MHAKLTDHYFDELNKITDVSRETFARLEAFVALLLKWNKAINLVSKSQTSPEDVWQRHIIDSIQLASYIPKNTRTITDFGSGAGFPGLILAILDKWQVHLIESDQRKCAFLMEATRELPNKVFIHNERIENLEAWDSDILTARALAPLDKLLDLTNNFHKINNICLFLKGQNVVEEIEQATKYWDIHHEIFQSATSETGKILKISNIRRI
jgi:16S rRNA (guanine527-N7)-methyltransferase